MPSSAAPSGDMVVNHARLLGGAGRRRDLEAGLAAMQPGDVVAPDEVLYVPQIRATTALSGKLPPSLFAARLTDQLRRVAGEALVDPVGQADGQRGLRFKSFASYAAWLLASWLTEPAPVSAPLLRAALNGQSVETWQRRIVLVDGRQLVKIVRLLAAQGLASAWAKRLAPQDLVLIATALAHDYALGGLEAATVAAASGGHSGVAPTTTEPGVDEAEISVPTVRRFAPASVNSLWTIRTKAEASGNDFASLPPAARIIANVLLGLSAKPNRLQTLGPDDWIQLAEKSRPVGAAPILPIEPIQPVAEVRHAGKGQSRSRSNPQPESPVAQSNVEDPCAEPAHVETLGTEPESEEKSLIAPPTLPAEQDVEESVAETLAPAIAALAEQPLSVTFRTEYGGLLFLINVLIWMGLYPDFTRPLDRGLEPSPFWLLAGLGRCLFGRRFVRDPLYRWLIENGREGALPHSWHIEPAWLAGIDAAPSPARRKWSRKPSHEYRRSAARRKDNQWLPGLADFLTFRLEHSAQGCTLRQLCLAAEVVIADDEIVARFNLNELPLPVRLAGLDRNPGWLPREGRNLSFEFA